MLLLFCTPALWSAWAAGAEPPLVQSPDAGATPQARRVELRLTASPRVEEKDEDAWLVVPLALANPTSEPAAVQVIHEGRPNPYSFALWCDKEEFRVQDFLPINNVQFYTITLPPGEKVGYALRYRILKAKPGTYHCRCCGFGKSRMNAVEFDISIPPGMDRDEPMPSKRCTLRTEEPAQAQSAEQAVARLRESRREQLLHALQQSQTVRLRVVTWGVNSRDGEVGYIRMDRQELAEVQIRLPRAAIAPTAYGAGYAGFVSGWGVTGVVFLELCDAQGIEVGTLDLTHDICGESELRGTASGAEGRQGTALLYLPDADAAVIRALPSVRKAEAMVRAAQSPGQPLPMNQTGD